MDGSEPWVDEEAPKGYKNTGTFCIRTKGKKGKNKVLDVSAYEFWGLTIPEAKANALLISKAPEMLEMLEKAMSLLGNVGEFEIAKEIEQLIKSATEL